MTFATGMFLVLSPSSHSSYRLGTGLNTLSRR